MTRAKAIAIGQAVLSVVLLSAVIAVAHPRRIEEAFLRLSPARLAPAAALGVVFVLVKFVKWQWLVRPHILPFGFMAAARTYLIGGSLGIVTPGSAGELGRAAFFAPGVRAQILYLTIVDRVTDAMAVALLAIAAAFRYGGARLGAAVVSLAVVLALFAVLPGFGRVRARVEGLLGRRFTPVPLATAEAARATSLALFAFLVVSLEFWFLLAASLPSPPLGLALVAPLIMLTKMLPISIMGLGVREGVAVLLLARERIPAPVAVSASLMMFALNSLVPALVGAVLIARHRHAAPPGSG